MKNAGFKIDSLKKPTKESCYYPSYDFFLDYNGDVLMCSHDWAKKNILGMMPHPERMVDNLISNTDGVNLFSSLLK